MSSKIYSVTNRSAGRVYYELPELGIKAREYQPGETKKITYEELEALSYLQGGVALLREYLQVKDEDARTAFAGKTEPEYNMGPKEVKELIQNGSMDEWLDCLDFAPEGVIDLIREISVELPLTNTEKMRTFREKKGINLESAIRARQEEKIAEQAASEEREAQRRRVAAQQAPPAPEEPTPTRRTSGSKYKVVSKEETATT